MEQQINVYVLISFQVWAILPSFGYSSIWGRARAQVQRACDQWLPRIGIDWCVNWSRCDKDGATRGMITKFELNF